MEIYIVGYDKYFEPKQLSNLKRLGKVYFLDTQEKLDKAPFYKSKDEKIIAISPSFCDYNFGRNIIDKIANLKAICLYTHSTHYIDVDYCKSKGIIITNTRNYACDAIAEYMMFLMLCVMRKLPLQIKYGKQEFSDFFMQKQLVGKTVGIVGLGNIGTKIADICSHLGMNIIYWSYNDTNTNRDYKAVSLKELFSTSDVIFSMLAISDLAKTFITDDLLVSMKKEAIFVSGTSTDLHNHELVLELVRKNKIYGYALEETNKTINDYMGNVMVTSEYGWYTQEAKQYRVQLWLDCIESVVKNKPINKV